MSNSVNQHSTARLSSALAQWVEQTIEAQGLRVKCRLRGNNLHLLCEASSCPDRTATLLWLVPALQQTDLNQLIPADHPPIYQVQLYGCQIGQDYPDWSATIYLNQLDRHLEHLKQAAPVSSPAVLRTTESLNRIVEGQSENTIGSVLVSPSPHPPIPPSSPEPDIAALALSNRSLAKQGQETAIACYLSETLSELGIAVQVSAKVVPYIPSVAVRSTTDVADEMTMKRLWVACQAAYSPDPALVGETITQKLRDLEIEGYRDAVIVFHVAGETQPDWMLRVDLTPPGEMLREWARWGDLEAIQRLLNQELENLRLHIANSTLNATTLHLFCTVAPGYKVPNSATDPLRVNHKRAKAEIALLLEALGPQGIHAATVYGNAANQETPVWVEWLDLPADLHPALADSPIALAQQGDWGAIAFLLHRLLNPNLDKYLATGGIRLQLLPKPDLMSPEKRDATGSSSRYVLHIMSEASLCPEQRQVAPVIARFLQQLQLPLVSGVRIYGRRAGQKTPLWSYGLDFVPRDRLVPEVTPEFAATDTYVSDLIAKPGEQVFRPDLTATDLQAAWTKLQQRITHVIHQGLLRSQLFAAIPEAQTQTGALPGQVSYQGAKLALVWGTAGLLLALQANWMLGNWLHSNTQKSSQQLNAAPVQSPPAPAPSPRPSLPEPPDTLPQVSLKQSPNGDSDIFNSSGFTQMEDPIAQGEALPSPATAEEQANSSIAQLPYTPQSQDSALLTASILAEGTPLPTFNSRQLDEKLRLYYRFLEESGKPDVLVVGSSRALRGIDPIALQKSLAELGYPDAKIFNFGVNGATAQVVNLLLQRILTSEQLPRLILWADGARAFNSGTIDVTYNGIVVSEAYRQLLAGTFPIPGAKDSESQEQTTAPPEVQGIHKTLTDSYQTLDRWLSQQLGTLSGIYPERDRLKNLFQDGFTAVLPDSPPLATVDPQSPGSPSTLAADQILMDEQGFLSLAVQFNPATYYQRYARVLGEYDSDYEDFQIIGKQENALRSLLQFTRTQSIPVIFVNLPLTEDYLDPYRLRHEQDFRDYMVTLSMNQPQFVFRDMSQEWTTQYPYFSDPSHLNRYGAYAVSTHLAQDPLIPWSKAEVLSSDQKAQQEQAMINRE